MEEIYKKLYEIIKKRYNLDLSNKSNEVKDENLLGNKIGFSTSELLYLYFDIEREFNIEIPEGQIISGGFSTINNIARMIQSQLQLKVICSVGAKI